MVKTHLQLTALSAFLLAFAGVASIHAQDQPATATKATVTPLKVTVTISRYQGEKRISSLPYTLSVNVESGRKLNQATFRMGAKVPVGAGTATSSISYHDVGTGIDCFIGPADETGRFMVQVTVDESTVIDDTPQSKSNAMMGRPTFRSFRTSESLMLKDGQSIQMSNTPDRTTGETVRVDVALAVVK